MVKNIGSVLTYGVNILNVGGYNLYNPAEVKEKLEDLEAGDDALRRLYKKMIKQSPARFLAKPSRMPEVGELINSMPNFAGPLKDIESQLALCLSTGDPIEITPFLLLGKPGLGKTHFAEEIANILQTESVFISMGTLTAGWILSGSASGWNDSRIGKVFENLLNGSFANPVIVLDEIDKASSTRQFDPLGPLYSLLERKTAMKFVDEFADVAINASHIIWITTANDSETIPKAIFDRLNVYEIEQPTQGQTRIIANTMYKNMRENHSWGKTFNETPSDDVLDVLSMHTPRDINSMLLKAFGNAKLVDRNSIEVRDLPHPKNKKRRMGF